MSLLRTPCSQGLHPRTPFLAAALVSLAFVLAALPVSAQVYYDNLGIVDVFDDTDVVSFVGDYSEIVTGSDWFQGYRFTSAATGEVASIDVAVGNYFEGPATMEFRLYADAGGSLGALLAIFPVEAVAENFDGTIRRGRIEPGLGVAPVLSQGAGYWLMATAPSPTIWFTNEQGDTLPRLWTPNGTGGALNSDTLTAAAFRVNGPPVVPLASPGVVVLLSLALAATGALAGQRRCAR